MKIISPDAAGQVDASVRNNILEHLPDLPIDIVPISWFPNFKFQPPPTEKYVLLDFQEPHPYSEEYEKFIKWVESNRPILFFVREATPELLAQDCTIKPIEFACYLDPQGPTERVQWASRPLELLNFWGFSHQSRPKLHSDIFLGMARDGLNVLSDWSHWIDGTKKQRNWLTVYTPHTNRKPMADIVHVMADAKVTVALPGNGLKTFRHTECVNTLMACWRDGLSWSYPWTDENSIQLTPHFEYQDLLKALETDLYDKYVACCENMKRYFGPTYAKDYVAKEIERVL